MKSIKPNVKLTLSLLFIVACMATSSAKSLPSGVTSGNKKEEVSTPQSQQLRGKTLDGSKEPQTPSFPKTTFSFGKKRTQEVIILDTVF